jgi:hypothetical protein
VLFLLALLPLRTMRAVVPPVTITVFGEQHCPHTAKFMHDWNVIVMSNPAFRDMVQLEIYWDFNSTTVDGCFHGELECEAQRLFLCTQELEARRDDWARFMYCVNGDCPGPRPTLPGQQRTGQFSFPGCCGSVLDCKDQTCWGPADECAALQSLAFAAIRECEKSSHGHELLAASGRMFADRDAKYCIDGCPVVDVAGERASQRFCRNSVVNIMQ